MSAANASVMRDGERRLVPASEIVAGDVILMEEGDTIPADARAVYANIRRFLRFLLSSNLGEVLTMFFGVKTHSALLR